MSAGTGMSPLEWYNAGMPKRCNVEKKCYPRAQWEIDAGMSPMRCTPGGTRAERIFCDQPPDGCVCNAVEAHQLPPDAKAEWMRRCPSCSGAIKASEGMRHSESLGGFVGPGMDKWAPDARELIPVAPPTPGGAGDPRATSLGDPVMTARFAPTNLGTPGTGGTPGTPGTSGGGGWVDTGINIGHQIGGSGWGQSKCKGPYDSVGGRCVLKPPTWGGWANYPGGYAGFTGGGGGMPGGYTGTGQGQGFTGGSNCPAGYTWDGFECKAEGIGGWVEQTLPGGQTGTGVDVYGQAVMGAFGKPAIVPATVAQPTRHCPPGTVLGKDNLCYARGSIRNTDRKWPKAPRPLLSAQDMKVIRKAASLKNRVKSAATKSGFSCRKR